MWRRKDITSKGDVLRPLKEKCGKKHMASKCPEKAKSLVIFQIEEINAKSCKGTGVLRDIDG